jgi:hypothetical protein
MAMGIGLGLSALFVAGGLTLAMRARRCAP